MDDRDDLSAALSAWVAPPAPSGMADRVIVRVKATDQAIAVTRRRRAKRRWWLAGGLVAALTAAAIAVVAIPRGTEPSGAGSGSTIVTRPQQLALTGAIANLDPGANVSWQQGSGAIHVQQHSGAATWRVDAPHLFLDVGAAVASIEASNATLRVETRMNLTDTRVIGATALASAAVALVTVAVYDGHVKLSGAGQTVIVEPGTTYEITPGQPPTVFYKIGDEPTDPRNHVSLDLGGGPSPATAARPELVIRLGEKITVHDPRGSVRIVIDKQCPGDTALMYPNGKDEVTGVGDYHYSYTCKGIDKHGALTVVQDAGIGVISAPFENTTWTRRIHIAGTPVPARAQVTIDGVVVPTESSRSWSTDVTPTTPNFIAVRIDAGLDDVNYYIRRGATDKTAESPVEHIEHGFKVGGLSVDAVEAVMKSIERPMIKCIKKRSDAQLLSFEVGSDGTVGKLAVSIDDPTSEACVTLVVKHARFPKQARPTHVSYSLAPPCNTETLLNAGTEAVARGAHAEALKSYEASLECKYDVHTMQLTFMAACRAGNVISARRHWKTMNDDMKEHLLQICVQEHITREQLDE